MKLVKRNSTVLASLFLFSMLFLSTFVMAGGAPTPAPEPKSSDIPLPASVNEVVENYLAEFSSEIIAQQLLSVTGDQQSNVIIGNFQNISIGDKRDISIRLYVDEPDINYIDGDYQIQYANWVILDTTANIIKKGNYQRISSGNYEKDLSLSFYKDGDFALIPYVIQYNIDYNFTSTAWEDQGYDVIGKEGQYIFVAYKKLFFQWWMMLILLAIVFGGISYFALKKK